MSNTESTLPAQFSAGTHKFELVLNYGLARRLRTQHGVDLVNFHNGQAVKKFAQDRDLLFLAIWKVLEEQALAKGLSEETFANLLDDTAFEAAFTALEEAIINFSRPAIRPALLAMLKKNREMEQKTSELLAQKLSSPEADQALQSQLDKIDQETTQKLVEMTQNPA